MALAEIDRVVLMTKRAIHDIGGLPGGPIDTHEHTPTLTERRIDALMMLLRDKQRSFFTTDENRRTIESMTPQMYEGSSYYERWVRSLHGLLVEKGVLSEAEIAARLAQVQARYAPEAGRAAPAASTATGAAAGKARASTKAPAKTASEVQAEAAAAAPGKTRAGARVKGEGGGA